MKNDHWELLTTLSSANFLVIGISKVFPTFSTPWVDPRGKSWLIVAKVVSSLEQDHVTPTHWSEPFANRLAFFFFLICYFFFPILNFDARFLFHFNWLFLVSPCFLSVLRRLRYTIFVWINVIYILLTFQNSFCSFFFFTCKFCLLLSVVCWYVPFLVWICGHDELCCTINWGVILKSGHFVIINPIFQDE